QQKIEVEGPKADAPDQAAIDSFGLESMVLLQGSRFAGKSIRECGLREAVNGLIVGIEREDQRKLNPDSTFVLKEGDRLWIVGDIEKIRNLKESSIKV